MNPPYDNQEEKKKWQQQTEDERVSQLSPQEPQTNRQNMANSSMNSKTHLLPPRPTRKTAYFWEYTTTTESKRRIHDTQPLRYFWNLQLRLLIYNIWMDSVRLRRGGRPGNVLWLGVLISRGNGGHLDKTQPHDDKNIEKQHRLRSDRSAFELFAGSTVNQ